MSFNLNSNQQKAVTYNKNKPLLIQAGPGAGKTRVIVERVKYLIKEIKINPESILVITFTHKAANELKERIAQDPQIDISTVSKMQISTIHSFCFEILSEFGISGLNILNDDRNEKINMFIRKHKRDLGFEYDSYLSGSQIDSVVEKFDEYATFDVDTPKLIKYIEENRPVSSQYLNLISNSVNEEGVFEFPYDEVKNNDEYKKSWYNAKYLSIAKAYPIYLSLLDKEETSDFNQIQIKTMNLLKDKEVLKKVRFKNILIDEFQDTDPIQMEIFKSLLSISDSFTIVGDDDQSIYGFRGSVPKFFTDFAKNFDSEVITLDINYRSIPEIVSFNEKLIEDTRVLDKNLVASREDKSPVYYINSYNKPNEAENIVKVIKNLKKTGKITQYSDVGILFRSLYSNNGIKIKDLLLELEFNDINYTLHDNPNLLKHDEVKMMITLLWYIKKDNDSIVLTRWEKDWLNYKAFTYDNYESEFFDLTDETMEVLRNIEDEYQQRAIEKEHEIYYRMNKKKSRIKKFGGLFKSRDEDILKEIFSQVKRVDLSRLSRNELKRLGITNKEDLDFFTKLNDIKRNLYNPEVDYHKRPTILKTFYDLLNLTNLIEFHCYINSDISNQIMLNLALLTNTIFNYEIMINKYDINGLFWYLSQNLERYSAPALSKQDDVDSVQIMTIHKSKGLEFPVTIVGSIEDDKFPKKYDIKEEVPDFVAGKPTYHTPDNCLKYKIPQTQKQKKEDYENEEKRILYVATTRAEDILILSTIAHKSEDSDIQIPKFLHKLKQNKKLNIKELNPKRPKILNKTSIPIKQAETERLNLSYSSFSKYNECPNKYNFLYNFQFKTSEDEYAAYGLLAHSILNQLHQKSMTQDVVTKSQINEIIVNNIQKSVNIKEDDEKLDNVIECVKSYWEDYGRHYNTLATELPFSIQREKYNLTGQIDLIIKENDNDITVIDFKTTKTQNIFRDIDKYKEQLYLYVLALREHPDYKDYNINKARVISILDELPIDFEVELDELEDLKEKINETVYSILHEYYYRNEDNCRKCEFNDTLCKNLTY